MIFRTFFLDNRIQNHSGYPTILQKYQSLSNKSFKHNPARMLSLNLIPTLPFEPRFRMFIGSTVTTEKENACSPWTPSCFLPSSRLFRNIRKSEQKHIFTDHRRVKTIQLVAAIKGNFSGAAKGNSERLVAYH